LAWKKLFRQFDRLSEPSDLAWLQLQEGNVGPGVGRYEENLVDCEFGLRRTADFLEEVDVDCDRIAPVEPDLERESRLPALGEVQGNMTIGHDQILIDQPSSTDVGLIERPVGRLDATDSSDRGGQRSGGVLEPVFPNCACGVIDVEVDAAV